MCLTHTTVIQYYSIIQPHQESSKSNTFFPVPLILLSVKYDQLAVLHIFMIFKTFWCIQLELNEQKVHNIYKFIQIQYQDTFHMWGKERETHTQFSCIVYNRSWLFSQFSTNSYFYFCIVIRKRRQGERKKKKRQIHIGSQAQTYRKADRKDKIFPIIIILTYYNACLSL